MTESRLVKLGSIARRASGPTGAVGHALRRPAGALAAVAGAIVVAVAFSWIANGYDLQLVDTICYYAMLTIGLNLVMGYAGQFDFGHTTFVAVGAYVAGLLLLNAPGLDYLVVIALSCVAAALVAAVLAVPVFRFRGDYLTLVTFGFGLIAQSVALNLGVTGGPNGLPGIPVAHLLGLELEGNRPYFFLGLVLTAGCAIVVWLLMRFRAGRAVLSVREDELAASTLGVDPWRYKVLAFVLAGALAGIAGAYAAGLFSFVGPEQFGLDQAILFAEMVLVGGLGSIAGSIAGAVVFVALESVLVVHVPALAGHEDFVVGIVMLVLILRRPQGLFGKPFVRRRT
ncbi:MAG: branched-chain amino acid ABC transporter permease [Candidatus Limnocylindrales bacterium]